MDGCDNHPQKESGCGSEKPPGAPNRRLDDQSEGAASLVPDAILVAGGDLKIVMAGRQLAIDRDPAVAGLVPSRLVTIQPIFEAGPFRSSQIQAGIMNLQPFFARGNA